LAEYARAHDEIRALGADVVALSVDAPERSEALRAQLALPFPILSDSAREVVRAWDLYNAKERGGIAIPAVFVIGSDRRVRWRSIDRTAQRVSTAGVLGFLRGEPAVAARRVVLPRLRDFARAVANTLRRGARTPHE
jgi:peroxiredoxin Q/BCP